MDQYSRAASRSSETPSFRIETLGIFRMSHGAVNCTFKSRKAQALFAYLAFCKNMIESRERLAGLLWGENSEEAARTSLRQLISGIKKDTKQFPIQIFDCDRNNVWLQPIHVSSDAATHIADLEQNIVPEVMITQKRLFGGFLVNLRDIDPSFDMWLSVQREYLHDRAVKLLQDQARREQNDAKRERFATAIHNLDPTHEEACRILMQCRASRGDTAGALRIYNDLWELLGTDYDMEPSPQTQALVAEIKTAEPLPAPPSHVPQLAPAVPAAAQLFDGVGIAAQARAEPPLILVHPFLHEAVHAIRINGFRHELIAAMTRFRDWSVREHSASDDALPPSGRKVYDLLATATGEDGELHIAVLLRRRSDGHYMWSENSEIEIGNWHRARLQIVRHLAAALDVQISAERLSTTAGLADMDLDIYDRWLRGNELLSRWRPADESRSEGIFRSIIRNAPDFAPAHASLAQILNSRHLIFPGLMRDRKREQEALKLANMASKLAPMDSRTKLTLAWSYLMNEKYEQAIYCYGLTLKMNDNDPWTLISCAQGLAYCGEKALADEIAQRALRVGYGAEPVHWAYHACIRFLFGNSEGAVEAADLAVDATFFVGGLKAAALAELGLKEAALEEAAAFFRRTADNWHGDGPASPKATLEWFWQCLPIRLMADRERLHSGILATGLLDLAG
ncbi:hypothetical protein NKJ87_11705 [Mesorhizobium sp. M0027]|uniref:BTAD domain-containing putative transcriptional regulator n=1 Tax=Mesorhizobium sp. M0027 TaxID=2956848 RepID=UPI003338F765